MDKPRKILWTERSSADIEAIVRYIARRDPEAAGRIGFGIQSDGTIVKKVDAAYLRESILDPGARVPKGFEGLGVGMPSYLGILKDWQIEALILYLETLK